MRPNCYVSIRVGPDNSVGIVICYGLDGPGNESRWGRDFPHPSGTSLEPIHPPVEWVLSPPGGKAVGA